MGEVIDFYNQAVADLPDAGKLKGLKLPGASVVLDVKGERFAEMFEQNQRRVWVPLVRYPRARAARPSSRPRTSASTSTTASTSVADPRLHRQPRAVRAAAGRLDHHPAGGEEPAGGRRRHLRAQDARDDRRLPDRAHADQGRDPRALSQLDLSRPRRLGHRDGGAQLFRQAGEGAVRRRGRLLAGLTKGPNYFNPDRHPERAQRALCLRARPGMQEDGSDRRRRRCKRLICAAKLVAYESRAATSASISSTRSPARPRRSPASMR